MPAAQSPKDNAALIGGIVGGAVALLLIGALIAFFVVRSRRKHKQQLDPSALSLRSTPPSNYARVNLSDRPASNYTGLFATSEHDTYANGQLELAALT